LKQLNDFTLKLGNREFVPIMLGGMGVDVSVPALALEVARLGGIAHLSDAMLPTVVDRHFQTHFVRTRFERFRMYLNNPDKSGMYFDPEELGEAIRLYVSDTMAQKTEAGAIYINVMEKLVMGDPRESMKIRLGAAMDGGIDGLTLSAGLHLGTLELIRDHPRFRDVKIGIIVSSARALKLFLHRAGRLDRLPDYIVIEGPLAGGHLGFPLNWYDYDLKTILGEVMLMLDDLGTPIPVIAAGGIFTGSDAVEMMEMGASGVQVATRFAITKESGLPMEVKQRFLTASEEDVEVNSLSPTGYPMRMLKQSPAIGTPVKPNCEAFGYGIDNKGNCPYLDSYNKQQTDLPGDTRALETTCLCTMMHGYKIWTCGQNVYRLKDTTNRLKDGSYQLPTAEQVFRDYQFSTNHQIMRPPLEVDESEQEVLQLAHAG